MSAQQALNWENVDPQAQTYKLISSSGELRLGIVTELAFPSELVLPLGPQESWQMLQEATWQDEALSLQIFTALGDEFFLGGLSGTTGPGATQVGTEWRLGPSVDYQLNQRISLQAYFLLTGVSAEMTFPFMVLERDGPVSYSGTLKQQLKGWHGGMNMAYSLVSGIWSPFVWGGLAWSRYSVSEYEVTMNEAVFTLPVDASTSFASLKAGAGLKLALSESWTLQAQAAVQYALRGSAEGSRLWPEMGLGLSVRIGKLNR